jgi:hypothetical protein
MMGPPCGAGGLNSLKYRNLSAEDLADWENWVNMLGADRFLDEIIEFCAQYTYIEDAAGFFLQLRRKFRDNKPLFSQLIGYANKLRTKSGS